MSLQEYLYRSQCGYCVLQGVNPDVFTGVPLQVSIWVFLQGVNPDVSMGVPLQVLIWVLLWGVNPDVFTRVTLQVSKCVSLKGFGDQKGWSNELNVLLPFW